jgi:hypothetical protein
MSCTIFLFGFCSTFSFLFPLKLFPYITFHRFEALPDYPTPSKFGCEAFLVSYKHGILRDIPGLEEMRSFKSFRYAHTNTHTHTRTHTQFIEFYYTATYYATPHISLSELFYVIIFCCWICL